MLLVAALIGLISVVGGALVLPTGEPTETWEEAVWWAFLRLTDPGYLGDDQGVWRRIVSTFITVAGYVIFLGSLVAIITTWLNRKIRNLEQGLTPVTADNHLIILGWTNRTLPIAAEIFQSTARVRRFLKQHRTRNLQLIILSEDVTLDHRQELRDYPLIGSRARDVILRSGDAIDREHLRRVDSLNAAAIIIPSPTYQVKELITPDIETIKALLSLNAESHQQKRRRPYVVAEIQDENKLKAAYRAYTGPLEVIGSNTIISRLLAQNTRHPGLSEVYNELFSRSVGNNLFVRDYPGASGHTLNQLRSAFPKAILLGLVRVENGRFTPLLNLAGETRVAKNDRLVLIARQSTDIDLPKLPAAAAGGDSGVKASPRVRPAEPRTASPIRILILGWNLRVPALLKEFSSYDDETYHITSASLRPLADREKELEFITETGNPIPVEHLEIDYVKESQLRKVNPAGFDHILFVSSDRLTQEEEADARTLVGYVLLEELLEGVTPRPRVILELSDPSNETLIRRFHSEVIVSPMILSHLLAAIALRRELNTIYNELLTAGGAEIVFRDPEAYGLAPGSYPFSAIETRIAEYGDTALGLFPSTELGKDPARLVLNPARERHYELTTGTRFAVLTTSGRPALE